MPPAAVGIFVLGPVTEPVPDKEQCARHICQRRRTAEGEHHYCSAFCLRISDVIHGPKLPALASWTWLPVRPREVRVPD